MIKTRKGVFETNSSSTHTLVVLNDDDYLKLDSGEYLLDNWNGIIKPKEEVLKDLRQNYIEYNKEREDFNSDITDEELLSEYNDGWTTLDEFFEDEYLEGFDDTHTTPSGDIVHIFGKYGYGG